MKGFIRKFRPKKMYERREREGYDLVTNNSKRKKLVPRHRKKNVPIGLIARLCVFILAVSYGGWLVHKYTSYEKEREDPIVLQDHRNFDYLMWAGDMKMERGGYEEAAYEYELALDIFPYDSTAQRKYKQAKSMVNETTIQDSIVVNSDYIIRVVPD